MIVLSMIVKNEAHCIERCITSVLPFIKAAVIVDTGSTDDTKEVLNALLWGRERIIYDRPWVNFGVNRTHALWHAFDEYPNDYALVMDADEEFVPGPGFKMPDLDRAGYAMWQESDVHRLLQPRLLRLSADWVYQGAMHEYAESLGLDKSRGIIENCTVKGHFDSARNKQGRMQKYLADAVVMETMPETPRNVFYKAQCYRNAQCYDKAITLYRKRTLMEGFEEEVYISLLSIAQIYEYIGCRPAVVANAYEQAYLYRKSRAEAPYYLAKFCRARGHHSADYWFDVASKIPMTTDQLFIDLAAYSVE